MEKIEVEKANGATIEELHDVIEHMEHELEYAGIELFDAMLIACSVFAYPIRQLTVFTFAGLTKRAIRYKFEDALDIALCLLVFIWVEHFLENHTPGIDEYGYAISGNEVFVKVIIEEIDSGSFHFDFILALIAGCFWLRVLIMLKLT